MIDHEIDDATKREWAWNLVLAELCTLAGADGVAHLRVRNDQEMRAHLIDLARDTSQTRTNVRSAVSFLNRLAPTPVLGIHGRRLYDDLGNAKQ